MWFLPAVAWVKSTSAGAAVPVGRVRPVWVPSPIWPWVLSPHAYTCPSLETDTEWEPPALMPARRAPNAPEGAVRVTDVPPPVGPDAGDRDQEPGRLHLAVTVVSSEMGWVKS